MFLFSCERLYLNSESGFYNGKCVNTQLCIFCPYSHKFHLGVMHEEISAVELNFSQAEKNSS